MTGEISSIRVGLLKERGMVSRVSGAVGSWRAADGSEGLHARLILGSETGEWLDGQGTPALSPASSLPSLLWRLYKIRGKDYYSEKKFTGNIDHC